MYTHIYMYIADGVFTFHSWHQQLAVGDCIVEPLLFISDECLALNYMVFLYSTLFSLHFSAIEGGTFIVVVTAAVLMPLVAVAVIATATADSFSAIAANVTI